MGAGLREFGALPLCTASEGVNGLHMADEEGQEDAWFSDNVCHVIEQAVYPSQLQLRFPLRFAC